MKPLRDYTLKCKVQALPLNIILGWKRLTVTNSLAYYSTELTRTVKIVIAYDSGANVKNLFS